jgi:hypothetical protein
MVVLSVYVRINVKKEKGVCLYMVKIKTSGRRMGDCSGQRCKCINLFFFNTRSHQLNCYINLRGAEWPTCCTGIN